MNNNTAIDNNKDWISESVSLFERLGKSDNPQWLNVNMKNIFQYAFQLPKDNVFHIANFLENIGFTKDEFDEKAQEFLNSDIFTYLISPKGVLNFKFFNTNQEVLTPEYNSENDIFLFYLNDQIIDEKDVLMQFVRK